MAYEQLADHAAKLEQSAIITDLRQRGFGYDNDRIFHSGLSEAEVSEAANVTAGRFSDVAEMFTPFLGMPDPAEFSAVARRLAAVATILNHDQASLAFNGNWVLANNDLGLIDDVKQLVSNWRGVAALTFKDRFLSTWHPIIANQLIVMLALKGGVEAEYALWRAARKNADDIAHHAQTAIDAVLDCNPKALSFLLTAAGSIFAIGGAMTTGGLSLGLTIVGEVGATVGAIPRKDPEPLVFNGRTVPVILAQVQDALRKLTLQIVDAENVIRDAMTSAVRLIDSDPGIFVAPRPMLADTTRATIRDSRLGLGESIG